MKYLTLLVLALIITAVACSNTKKTSDSNRTEPRNCLSMELLKTSPDSIPMDPLNIDSLKIVKGCLDVYVSYGGGCGEVKFNLYYTNLVQNSFPPQTTLYLSFEDKDNCRAIETKKLSFDLQPFKKQAGNGGIYFNLKNNKGAKIFYEIRKN